MHCIGYIRTETVHYKQHIKGYGIMYFISKFTFILIVIEGLKEDWFANYVKSSLNKDITYWIYGHAWPYSSINTFRTDKRLIFRLW